MSIERTPADQKQFSQDMAKLAESQPPANQHKGFATEAIARERARQDFADRRVYIILSNGQYYVEPEDGNVLIRTWERQVYFGLGRRA